MASEALQGIIHGRTIELDTDAGLTEGERVEVIVRRIPERREPGIGFLRTEGALADDPEWDAIMDEIQRERKRERRSTLENE